MELIGYFEIFEAAVVAEELYLEVVVTFLSARLCVPLDVYVLVLKNYLSH